MLRSTALRLPLFLGILLAFGCDSTTAERSAAPATAQSVAIALEGRPNGDYFYDLAPLDVRERFEATLVGSAGALRLRFQGTGGGRGFIQLETAGQSPDDVVLDYLANGTVVATQSFDGEPRETYEAGTADREPDSVHYVWHSNGTVEIIYDYKDDSAAGGEGTTMTALDGEQIKVTDIRFVVDEANIGKPEVLELTSASLLSLR